MDKPSTKNRFAHNSYTLDLNVNVALKILERNRKCVCNQCWSCMEGPNILYLQDSTSCLQVFTVDRECQALYYHREGYGGYLYSRKKEMWLCDTQPNSFQHSHWPSTYCSEHSRTHRHTQSYKCPQDVTVNHNTHLITARQCWLLAILNVRLFHTVMAAHPEWKI